MVIWAGLFGAYAGGFATALIGRALNRAEGTAIAVLFTLGGMALVCAAWSLVVSVGDFGDRVRHDHILIVAYNNGGLAFLLSAGVVIAAALPFLLIARSAGDPPVADGPQHTVKTTGLAAKTGKDDNAPARVEPTI